MYSNYEEALAKVKGMNFLTKPALKEKEKMLNEVEASLEKVKKILAKGENAKLDTIKATLTEAVATIANAKEESKDLAQISMRTQSKASKK